MAAQILAVIIFIVMFGLIIWDHIERHIVSLGCGLLTLVLVFGVCMHSEAAAAETLSLHSFMVPNFWFQTEAAAESSSGINWATILFIAGMMLMVEGMERAGFFRWLCLTIAKAVHYKTIPIFISFMLMSAFLAMFIDSITVILFLAAVTVELAYLHTYSLLHGFKGISVLAKVCIYMFFGLILFVLLAGGHGRYIIETGIESLGRMVQNFIVLSTYTDPLRSTGFAQDWTIYYWAYWMVWCVAAPFFIGNISRGRTIKQTVLGGYIFGAGSTLTSFIVLGNYGMGLQTSGEYDFISKHGANGDVYQIIINIIQTLPLAQIVLIWVLVTMIAFYATSFDSIAYTASCYSYKKLEEKEHPHKLIQLLWCILLIILPVALVFSDSSMNNLQSVSIIAAFPLGIVMILIVCSFFKDARKYLMEQ